MAQTSPCPRAVALLCAVLGFIAGGVIGYFTPHPSANAPPLSVAMPSPTANPSPTPTPAPLRIHVTGAVLQPDVYALPPGSTVEQAVEAAGGPAPDADLERINLAQELHDQQQVYVPRQGMANPPPISGGGLTGDRTGDARININTATAAELETLPRIGPATAQQIIAYREANGPFTTIDEIQNVPGIGPATFAQIKDAITVGFP